MAHDFGDADVGKTVVSAEGRRIGSVDDIEEGRASIRFDPDAPGELAAALGADDTGTSTLRREHVDTVTDDEVRLSALDAPE